MTVQVEFSAHFEKELKRLHRKYPGVIDEISTLVDEVPNVGFSVHKVRLRDPGARKGKSGGLRVLYYVQQSDLISLISIYSKSEQTDISPDKIRLLIEHYENPRNDFTPNDDTE